MITVGSSHIYLHGWPTSSAEYLWVISALIVIYMIVRHILTNDDETQ